MGDSEHDDIFSILRDEDIDVCSLLDSDPVFPVDMSGTKFKYSAFTAETPPGAAELTSCVQGDSNLAAPPLAQSGSRKTQFLQDHQVTRGIQGNGSSASTRVL